MKIYINETTIKTERKTMITSKMTRAEVEAILGNGGNFLKAQVD